MKPTVGRIVYYITESGPLAAIIVAVKNDKVNLTVFHANGTSEPKLGVAFGQTPGVVGTWLWPRVT
jgi:hypothetical protein